MANIIAILVIIATLVLNFIEMRSIHKLNSVIIPENWQTDNEYYFQWKGSFTYGLPPDSTCPRVFQPEHGRFVCSTGTIVDRNMCLVECKKGFEQTIPPVVYICQHGIWKNLKHQPISTPEPSCVPKTHNFKEHFPQ